MYNNENYNEDVRRIEADAKKIETEWLAGNLQERKSILKEYPSPVRPHQRLWANSPPAGTIIPDYPPCPRCGAGELQKEKVLDGVRHNGDGYGAIYNVCRGCGWTVWWLYDEA